ncbi:Tripartite tricarboxylate transporter TctB family protein [Tranquillimonas rosea]|uniref:Tripartite tricarboxylate transporter TctB family protein n=1 Tax=Tranquillimonas rosea TaxID=641238 RepID=A0A1H9SPD2_9RHOB|nr:tripartite tricarboxylate transporter TctB family protein [Tranquillimonas rosea]SER86189.1 Tripartite tricarboxylate transporter TctB family protein [Tranquillimonas rosea]
MSMAKADRVTAVVLFGLGLSMSVGGWTMDRLEVRNIHPASIPGLVPIFLGALLAICAVLLWFTASRQSAEGEDSPFMADGSWTRLALTAATCLVYALLLVGWLPFFWATAIFVATFSLIFSWPETPDTRARAMAAAGSVVLGIGVAYGTAVLFEQAFLVRLP